MKQFIVRNIPDDVHRAFKVLCAGQEISLQDKMVVLMKAAIEADKRKGKT